MATQRNIPGPEQARAGIDGPSARPETGVEWFRVLIDAIPDLILVKDGASRWMELNTFGQRLFGLEGKAFRGCHDQELPLDRALFGPTLSTCHATDEATWQRGIPSTWEEYFPVPGGLRTFDVLKVPLFHPNGRRKALVVFGRDASVRTGMEAELRRVNTHLAGVLAALPDLVVLLDPENRMQAVRAPQGMPLLVPETQALGLPLDPFLPPDLRIAYQEALQRIRQGTSCLERIEYPLVVHDGSQRHYEARMTPSDEGTAVILVREVTDRVEAIAALRASEARLQTVMEHAPDTILQVSLEGRILYINKTHDTLRREDVVGTDWLAWMPQGEDRRTAQDAFRHALATGEQVDYQVQGGPPQGPHRWYQARLSPVLEDGKVASVIVFATDITRQREAEEARALLEQEVLRAQKMESLGSLAGGVAHDMNNVLAAILGLASACRSQEPAGSRMARAMGTIITACERGGTLVRGLLDFTRQQLAEARPVDLNALIREEVQLLERTTFQRIRLVMDLEPGLPPILGEGAALSHALMNLCVNAVDAMPEGGVLTLATRLANRDRVELHVRDTGCGMPAEVLARAMDPFFTTKPVGRGTGLGLSLVYGTMKAHRGTLHLESTPGTGTLVILSFPALDAGLAPVADRDTRPTSQPIQVLVVDDDPLVREGLTGLLDCLACETRAAASGEEAVALVEASGPPDVVILDMNMPGMGGEETLQHVRRHHPDLPILLTTGRTEPRVLELARIHRAVTFLPKPFGLEGLQEALASLANSPREPSSGA